MDDLALRRAFDSSLLPAADWTHRAHLRIACIYSREYALDEAHLRVRLGIIHLNASHGLVETPNRGYHETLTRFWLVLVRSLLRTDSRGESSEIFVTRFEADLSREAPFRYYTRERLLAVRARAVFVEPDLLPLPTV